MSSLLAKTLAICSVLVPKKSGLVVFSMAGGKYNGNSRALFEYIALNSVSDIHVVWLAPPGFTRKNVVLGLRRKVILRNSFYAWWLCSRAHLAVLSHGFGDFGYYREIIKKKKVLMLWHAIGIKRAGLLDRTGLLDRKFNNLRKQRYIKRETRFYNAMICSSDIDRYYTASYTGLDVNSVKVTGLPRNDYLFQMRDAEPRDHDWFSILYAPTFRDYPVERGSVFFPFRHDATLLADWARHVGIRFLLRPHPNDQDSLSHVCWLASEHSDVFLDGGVVEYPEVTKLLLSCEGIVTDYSSTYVDGLLLDRPAVFVDYDRDRYMEQRGLAYGYDLVTPGPKVRSLSAFQSACEDMMEHAPAWAEHREVVRSMFYKYRDANACARVSNLIKEMMSS